MKLYKREGQHILKDRALMRRIIRYAELESRDVVLEVGCGTGNLTEFIIKKAGKVYGIEKDRRFIHILERRFESKISEGKFTILHGDALKIEWPDFDKFVSNIPYSISSPLTLRLLTGRYRLAVVMYQREFAERLTALPGSKNYGRLSVMARALCNAEILEFVKPSSFYPKPKVDSAIVRITPEPQIRVKNLNSLDRLLKTAFSMRRKKFGNIARKLGISISEGLKNERPENISPEVYAELSERL